MLKMFPKKIRWKKVFLNWIYLSFMSRRSRVLWTSSLKMYFRTNFILFLNKILNFGWMIFSDRIIHIKYKLQYIFHNKNLFITKFSYEDFHCLTGLFPNRQYGLSILPNLWSAIKTAFIYWKKLISVNCEQHSKEIIKYFNVKVNFLESFLVSSKVQNVLVLTAFDGFSNLEPVSQSFSPFFTDKIK
jgi:hypothetical protein